MSSGFGAARAFIIYLGVQDDLTGPMARIQSRTRATGLAMQDAGKNVGLLRAQFTFLGLVTAGIMVAVVRQSAEFQRQITLGSLAVDATTNSVRALKRESMDLAHVYRQLPTDMAILQRQVAQMGITTPSSQRAIAEAGVLLSVLSGGEIAADKAATSVFRLLRLTTTTQSEFDKAALGSRGLAAGFAIAGDASSAGISDFTNFMERFSQAAIGLNFTREQLIALGTVFTDIAPQQKEMFRTSVMRLFAQNITHKDASTFARVVGVTREEFLRMRAEDPAGTLIAVAEGMQRLSGGTVLTADVMAQLGITGQRTVATLNVLASGGEKFRTTLARVSEEMRTEEGAASRMDALHRTMASRIDALKSSVQGLAIAFGNAASAGIMPLVAAFQLLAGVLQNPAFARFLVYGGAAVTIAALRGGFAAVKKEGGFAMSTVFASGAGRVARSMAAPFVVAAARSGFVTPERAAAFLPAGAPLVVPAFRRARRAAAVEAPPGFFSRLMANMSMPRLMRFLSGGGTTRAMGILAGTIASLVLLLPLLAKPLSNLADMLSKVGQQGSFLSGVMKFLGNLLRGVAIVFNLIGLALDWVGLAFRKIGQFLAPLYEFLGLGKVGYAVGEGGESRLQKTLRNIENTRADVQGKARNEQPLPKSSITQAPTTNINVYSNDPKSSERFVRDSVAKSALYGVGSTIRTRRVPV